MTLIYSFYKFFENDESPQAIIGDQDHDDVRDFPIDHLKESLQSLVNSTDNYDQDAISIALRKIDEIFTTYSPIFYSPTVSQTLLDIFVEFNFIGSAISILQNSEDPVSFSVLFNILALLFDVWQYHKTFSESHPIAQFVTQEILDCIARIVLNPTSMIPEDVMTERIRSSYHNTSLTSLFGTTDTIPVGLYHSLRGNGLRAITELSKTNPELILFALETFFPPFFHEFIENNPGEELLKEFSYLCQIFLQSTPDIEQTEFFQILIDIFIRTITINNQPNSCSMYSLIQCINKSLEIIELLIQSPLPDNFNLFIKSQNEDALIYALELFSILYDNGNPEQKMRLQQAINLDLIAAIGTKESFSNQVQITFCKTIYRIINHNPQNIQIIYEKGIVHSLIKFCIESGFNVKIEALIPLTRCVQFLLTSHLDHLIRNTKLIDCMIQFITDVDDQSSICILDALSFILEVGPSPEIIQYLFSAGLKEQLCESVELLKNVENIELMEKAEDFSDKFLNADRELEDLADLGLM